MKNLARASAGLLASVAPLGAQANPGLHRHPHPAHGAEPYFSVDPAIGLILVVIFWAASVWAIEKIAARRVRM